MIAAYAASLGVVLRHRMLTLLVFLATIALTVDLYIKTPKGYFPQDDTGLIFGGTRASPDISFEAMKELQQRVTDIVLADPAVAAIGSSVGTSGFNASVNQGRLFISLKPLAERGISTQPSSTACARSLLDVGGMRVFMVAAQDVRAGGRQSSSTYQFTLVGSQSRRAAALGAASGCARAAAAGARRCQHRSRAGRSAGQCDHRSRWLRRGSACASRTSTTRSTMHSRSGRFRPSMPSATISRHPRGRSAVSARSHGHHAHLCQRRRQYAGRAIERGAR